MLQDRFLIRLVLFVVTVHLALLLYLALQQDSVSLPLARKVKVRSVQLSKAPSEAPTHSANRAETPSKPMKKSVETVAKMPSKKVSKAKKKVSPEKKKEKKKTEVKKEKTPAKSNTTNVDTKRQEAVKKAQASLAKLTKVSKNSSTSNAIEASAPRVEFAARTNVPSTQSTSSVTNATTYENELTQRLRMELRLPEYGEVRIALILTRDGRVRHVEVTETQSAANRNYVQSKIPSIRFSEFGKRFPEEDTRRFVLILTNDL